MKMELEEEEKVEKKVKRKKIWRVLYPLVNTASLLVKDSFQSEIPCFGYRSLIPRAGKS